MKTGRFNLFATMFGISMIAGLILASPGLAQTFKKDQLRYPRVREAVKQKETHLKQLFADQGLSYPPRQIFIRIFKQEQIVELWGLSEKDTKFHLVTSYPICAPSGTLGPKRRESDLQVPEGFYHIDRFNPFSNFHLSLGLDYPNASDRVLGVRGNLGGDVFIHGSCVTIGCVPITDDKIKELYVVAVEARSNGQREIPVHIFPTRLDDRGMGRLQKIFSKKPDLLSFWENLKPGYDYFEEKRIVPIIRVDSKGAYHVQNEMVNQQHAWKSLGEGLWIGEFASPQKSPVCDYPITVLKIDPNIYNLKLISASEHDGKSRRAKEWADQFGLLAAINASMYAQDHLTSTGYMKNLEHVNNSGINSKFGAFMAFNPINGSVPPVQIIDRYDQDWTTLIPEYNTVIQNYRMISLKGRNVWKQSDKIYSIAAVGMDKDGNILFIHSRSPYSVHDFNHILLRLPLNIRNAMYVEGGPEATLYVKAGGVERQWVGSYETAFTEHDNNNEMWEIPNVIGIAS